MIPFNERIYWNNKAYGKVFKLNLRQVIIAVALLPICTSWLFLVVPFIPNKEIMRW